MAMKNADFLCLFSMTGRGLLCVDPRLPFTELAPGEDDEVVGAAVTAALKKSSVLATRDFKNLIRSGAPQVRQERWTAEMSRKFSYRDEREMFRSLLQLGIKEFGGFITLKPKRHDQLKHWVGMPVTERIFIPSDNSTRRIGEALQEAFGRCKNECAT